jgi:hypothetical protein
MPQPTLPPDGNIYLSLTNAFNEGRFRAIICSGQAVVLHKLAIMSKDGDWIVREDDEALAHVRSVLGARGARYRYGAPLDVRWMSGGWSAHFEFPASFRVRADFFTRPPRLTEADLARIWIEQSDRRPPFLDPVDLAEMKKTNREKDYVVIGELGRIMSSPGDQLRYSRSARDLIKISTANPEALLRVADSRPLLREVEKGEDHIARLLDEERRHLMRRNEERLLRFANASEHWRALWPEVERKTAGMPLAEAHAAIVELALNVLPFSPEPPRHG